jgi:hypothetical protein
MADSYPVVAVSSPADPLGEIWLDSDAEDVATIAREGVGKGSGSQQPEWGEQFLAARRHLALLQILTELSGGFALGFAHRLDHASLGHATEITVDGWRPACCRNIRVDGFGDAVGVSQRMRPPIPGLVDCVDAERDAMRELRIAAVRIECGERVPQVGGLARQLRGPPPMPLVDSLGGSAVLKTKRVAGTASAVSISPSRRSS